ncbi:nitrous oxide reductase accessory protein NosL [Bacillus sp. FJAT-47783]|uniref:nitrous oxide reductase accessory protein NosL n=1 Tax=Bacillus sp. FJAT-47783 TaxID=2922712 RepID=UPI001FAB9F53|nr:nitrous oxide reductase accessory protein NosL [Bacillus sp. FJAT-47783]
MKKCFLFAIVSLFMLALAACGGAGNNESTEEKSEETVENSTKEEKVEEVSLKEPDEETECVYCQMTVYTKDSDMGMFSAQALTEDGENLFFDDIGCMLNQERMDNTTFKEKYVRDYNTREWTKLEEATIVKAEIKTPMNYGYAFFTKEDEAKSFIEEHGSDKAKISTLSDIDEVASHRHIKKMEKMKNGSSEDHGEEHDMNDGHADTNESMDMSHN